MEKAILALILLTGRVSAHTWLESLRLIGPNGAFTGEPGFPRGFISRQDPAYSDDALTYRITAKEAATPLCHPAQQLDNGYSNPEFPRLKASAGSFVALTYQENGHVSAPQVPEGRPYRSGNVYVYASTSLRDEEFEAVHGNWTADGELKSGRLLGTHFYDDDSCYQNQGSAGTPINSVDCQTDIQLPEDIDSDRIALYWIWSWPLWPNTEKEAAEFYVACAEIDISGVSSPSEVSVDSSIPINQRAVQTQLDTQFEVFELGTGTAAPPPVTSTKIAPSSAPSTTHFPSSTASEVDECSGLTTVYVPSATVTVTVTAAGPTARVSRYR
ncbi:hypothetical protein KVR01_007056 [Diaporthe batatas]|uniref:uncharacterized protein n=1 Tax=Diaporthe batatas TaxID=748121 RepID=UPI001D056A25|nr:uncharacterized protein KVR01_007056 [Diaporthe batatas]KAG8163759.1 hypothetical protein KVR01_007056 [Diaporthe batatas]